MWSVGGRSGWTLVEWLLLIEREMLVFALFWFLIGMADELAIDLVWFYLRRKPQNRTPHLEPNAGAGEPAVGRLAVFVAAWREADVIGTTIADMLGTWRDSITCCMWVAMATIRPRWRRPRARWGTIRA
jgi:adsorption protein B